MKTHMAEKAFFLMGIIICLSIQSGCSAVASDEGLLLLNENISQEELRQEENPDSSPVQADIPETQLSEEMAETLEKGKKLLDKNGETAALIRRTAEAAGFDNAREGKMIYLNYGDVAAEYFASDETDPSRYFETYVDIERYRSYASFRACGRKKVVVDCLSIQETDLQKGQKTDLPDHYREKKIVGEWEMLTYKTGGGKYAEYFCTIPYRSSGSEGLLSVHMRFRLNTVEPENSRDPVFLKAVEAVVPVEVEGMP